MPGARRRCPSPVPGWPVSGALLLSRAAMSGGRLAGLLACWLPGWPITPLGISALGGPRACRSAVGTRASFPRGGPSASFVASTVGSLRCGSPAGAGGAAASSFIGVAAGVLPSGTGAGLGWLFMWPASARVLPVPSAAVGRAAALALGTRHLRREPVAWRVRPRGVGRDGGVRQGRVQVRAGGRETARWRFRGPYCRSGWWVVALM